jgi:hypothetical protein
MTRFTERAERAALVEAAFRIANERMAAWEERHHGDAGELYLCECADPDCREKVELTRDRYDAVRRHPQHFFVSTGHVVPDLEEVIESHGSYQVIEKPGNLLELLRHTDPRSEPTGPATAQAETLADDIAE